MRSALLPFLKPKRDFRDLAVNRVYSDLQCVFDLLLTENLEKYN